MSEDINNELIEAIRALDTNEDSHFTKAGVPDCNNLREVLGRSVKTGERDAAWAYVQASPIDESSGNDDEPVEDEPVVEDTVEVDGVGFEFHGTYPNNNTIQCRGYVFAKDHATIIPQEDETTISKLRGNPTFEEVTSAD